MIGVILFALFFIFLFMGLPVGFALGVSSLAAIGHAGYPITVLAQRMFTAVDSFPLMAIPLFMLAGALMSHGGITKRIIDFCLCFVGPIRGGLAMVVAITGIMGNIRFRCRRRRSHRGIMVPEMTKESMKGHFQARYVPAAVPRAYYSSINRDHYLRLHG
ncbi:MAG: TRAP transporter large permease subunit [[Clostridium] symbiosum]